VPPTLNTDGTPVTTLTGYHIYYGTSAGALTQSIPVSGATTASYEITGLSPGTWYFAVAADAADGTESPPSNVGSKTI
jgi:fibronectin type III domain protein